MDAITPFLIIKNADVFCVFLYADFFCLILIMMSDGVRARARSRRGHSLQQRTDGGAEARRSRRREQEASARWAASRRQFVQDCAHARRRRRASTRLFRRARAFFGHERAAAAVARRRRRRRRRRRSSHAPLCSSGDGVERAPASVGAVDVDNDATVVSGVGRATAGGVTRPPPRRAERARSLRSGTRARACARKRALTCVTSRLTGVCKHSIGQLQLCLTCDRRLVSARECCVFFSSIANASKRA